MSPREIEQAVKRCDRRRRWPWIVFWTVIVALIIAGGLGTHGPLHKGKKTDALVTTKALINAVEQFQMDYDYLPQPTSAVQNQDCDSDTGVSEGFILILKGTYQRANPKAKDYL